MATPAPTMVMRPVQVSRSDRNTIKSIAASLRTRKFGRDAEALERVVERWDGAEGYIVVHGQQFEQLILRAQARERCLCTNMGGSSTSACPVHGPGVVSS